MLRKAKAILSGSDFRVTSCADDGTIDMDDSLIEAFNAAEADEEQDVFGHGGCIDHLNDICPDDKVEVKRIGHRYKKPKHSPMSLVFPVSFESSNSAPDLAAAPEQASTVNQQATPPPIGCCTGLCTTAA